MYKLAVIVGHKETSQGAPAGPPLDCSEYVYNTKVAQHMERLANDFLVAVFVRDKDLGYTKQIEKAYGQTDTWGADLTIELHFNGGPETARGTVTLSSGTAKSLRFAHLAQTRMLGLLNRTGKQDRGVKTRARSDRGGFSLVAGRAPAILVEPFFGSNEKDCKMMAKLGVDAYARNLLGAAQDMFDTFPRADIKKSSNMQSHTFTAAVGTAAAGLAAVEQLNLSAAQDALNFVKANWQIALAAIGIIAIVLAVRGMQGYLRDRKKAQRI